MNFTLFFLLIFSLSNFNIKQQLLLPYYKFIENHVLFHLNNTIRALSIYFPTHYNHTPDHRQITNSKPRKRPIHPTRGTPSTRPPCTVPALQNWIQSEAVAISGANYPSRRPPKWQLAPVCLPCAKLHPMSPILNQQCALLGCRHKANSQIVFGYAEGDRF